jgi:hypothetical protein
MYVAIADVVAEFESNDGAVSVLRSSPRGARLEDPFGTLPTSPFSRDVSDHGPAS